MLRSIGKGPRDAGPRGVVPRLLDCHDRIRRHVDIARRLGDPADAPRDQVAQAAEQVIGYFRRSLPHHSADEDESIAPRLRGAGIDAELADMTRQHGDIDDTLCALLADCDTLAAEPHRRGELRERIAGLARTLADQFDVHLTLEETVVFPAIERLPAPDQEAIVREMIARRA